MSYEEMIAKKVCDTVVQAGSTFSADKKRAYQRALELETNVHAKWALEQIIMNAEIAEKNKSPLCDDTGIPHIVVDVGPNVVLTGNIITSIKEGVRMGLRELPGRPMAVLGNDYQRMEQSIGMDADPGALDMAPLMVRSTTENVMRIHVLMFGGGPAIRGKSYRVFHKHDTRNVINEIVSWAAEGTSLLGCTPCTLAVGVGRSHYEASCMMLEAQVDGSFDRQNDIEKEITERINAVGVGPLSLGGKTTVLATFMKVGAQRASGIRVVCLRPCCCFEPRIASAEILV